MMIAAAVVTHGDLNGDLIVDNQNPVRVFGITITNIDTTDTFEVTFSGSDDVDFLYSIVTGKQPRQLSSFYLKSPL